MSLSVRSLIYLFIGPSVPSDLNETPGFVTSIWTDGDRGGPAEKWIDGNTGAEVDRLICLIINRFIIQMQL